MKKFGTYFKVILMFVILFSSILICGCELGINFDNGSGANSGTEENISIIETPKLRLITIDNSEVQYYTRYDNLAIITDNNPNASGYAFYIYSGSSFEDTKLYVRYFAENNYIELKDIFDDEEKRVEFSSGRYYFYVIALGGEKDGITYKNSPNSPIIYVDFKTFLEVPEMSINSRVKQIGWKNIPDADRYELWEGETEDDFSTYTKIAEIKNAEMYDFNEYYSNNQRDLHFKLRAIAGANTFFLTSEFSSSITFISAKTLYNPDETILTDDDILSWESINFATGYKVVVDKDTDNEQIFETELTSYDLSYLNGIVGCHNIYVVSVDYNEPDIYHDSAVKIVRKEVYGKLENPSNINISQNEKNIVVTFESCENARTFSVYINDNVEPIIRNLTEKTFEYSIEGNYDPVNEIVFRIKANENGYYHESDEVTSQSFKFIQYLKTPEIVDVKTNSRGEIQLIVEITPIDLRIVVNIENEEDGRHGYVYDLSKAGIEIKSNMTVPLDITDYIVVGLVSKISVVSDAYDEYRVTSPTSMEYSYANKAKLKAPEIISIKLSEDQSSIVLTWENIEFASGYDVYVNDQLTYSDITENTLTIPKTEITELEGGGYNFAIKTKGTGNYLTGDVSENVYYKGYDGLYPVTGLNISKLEDGFMVVWDDVQDANGYVLYIDNKAIELDHTYYVYETNKKVPYQILVKACAEEDEDSSFSEKKMVNMSTVNVPGYTDRYIYFGGWQDYYVTNVEEFNALCKYLFFSYEGKLTMFIDSSLGFNEEKYGTFIKDASDDFGTNSIQTNGFITEKTINGVRGVEFEFQIEYLNNTDKPALTSTNSAYRIWEEQTYFTPTESKRSADYNDFVTEKSVIEVLVRNTNELYMCAEGGAKPIFATNNYQAEESYNRAKEILREIINDDMTDFEKALSIYDYINYVSVYDSYYQSNIYNDRRFWLNGPLLGGVGVCDGIAKLYSLMCNMEGIKCVKITGYTEDEYGLPSGHAWNKIYIDADNDGTKEWYNVDLTWDEGFQFANNGSIYEASTHEYFLLSDAQFTNHYAYNDNYVADNDFNYYENYKVQYTDEQNGAIIEVSLYITTIEELAHYLRYLRKNYLTFNCRDVMIDIDGYTTNQAIIKANSSVGVRVSYYSEYEENNGSGYSMSQTPDIAIIVLQPK